MSRTALIVGASGLVGTAAVERFLADGWNVIGVSRRRPEVHRQGMFRHVQCDLRDPVACREMVKGLSDVTHVVYAAVQEKPGLVSGWTDLDHIDTNAAMLRNLIDPLTDVARIRHVTTLQGTKAYGSHLHAMRIPARERHPRDEHPNFYWKQEDYITRKAQEREFSWTIFRPQLVVGPNYGVAMNLVPVIGAYAAICRAEGRTFAFPGGPSYISQAVDARLVANAIRWAADAPEAASEHFNVTNGEVFEWRDLWPALAESLGVEPGEDEPFRLSEFLPRKADVWDQIVTDHELRPLSITELLGEGHHLADAWFAYDAPSPASPTVLSTIKIKQAGFCETRDTEESFREWLQTLVHRRVLPQPG